MQEGDRPGAAGEQLLGMLAAGAGPFPYRTGVHRLLGIPPRGGVRPPRAPFPADLPYETRAAFDPAVTAGPEAAGLLSSPPPIPIRGARPLASQPAPPATPTTAPRRDPSPPPTGDPTRSSTAGPAPSPTAGAAPSPTAAAATPVPAAEPVRRDEAPAKAIGLAIPGITSREMIPAPRPERDGDAKPVADAAPSPPPAIARHVPVMPPRESRDTGESVGLDGLDGAGGSAAPRIVSRRAEVQEVAEEPVRLRARTSSGGAAQVEALRAATMERAARRAPEDPPSAASAPRPALESPRPAPAAPPPPRVIVVRESEPARFTPGPFWSSSTLRGIHLGVLR